MFVSHYTRVGYLEHIMQTMPHLVLVRLTGVFRIWARAFWISYMAPFNRVTRPSLSEPTNEMWIVFIRYSNTTHEITYKIRYMILDRHLIKNNVIKLVGLLCDYKVNLKNDTAYFLIL